MGVEEGIVAMTHEEHRRTFIIVVNMDLSTRDQARAAVLDEFDALWDKLEAEGGSRT